MDHKRLLVWLLRLTGTFEMLAFIAVVMPRAWMEAGHEWVGLGAMSDSALLMFMIRQASYAYGMHGVSLWVLASDVVRFRTLIIFNGVSFLIAALVFVVIDYTTGMPLFWTISDGAGCGFFGVAALWLTRRGD
jgi:hypothetical protein